MLPFDLHSLWPQAVYLAPLMLLIFWGFWGLASYRSASINKANFAALNPRSKGIFWTKALFFSAAWLLTVAAIMQPIGNGHYPEGAMPPPERKENQPLQLKRKAHDVIILLDASASMAIKDARQQKSRLEYAKTVADEIVSTLTGENVALYAFTSMPIELSPLTMDDLFVRFMLAEIQIDEGGLSGTNLYEALATLQKKFFSAPSKRVKTVILLSDGGDTTIEALSGEKQSQAIARLTDLLADAKDQQLRVFSIGIGTKEGGIVPGITFEGKEVRSQLQERLLRTIAERGRGSYYEANAYSPVSLAEDLKNKMNQDPQYYDENQLSEGTLLQSAMQQTGLIYNHYFQIPLCIALLLLGFVFFWTESLTLERDKET